MVEQTHMISGFRRGVDEIFTVLVCGAVWIAS